MEPQQILRLLRRRGWKIVCWAIALAVIVGAGSHYLQTATYESSTQVLLEPNTGAQAPNTQSVAQANPATFAASQVVIVRSPAVARAAAAIVTGHPAPGVLLSQVRVAVNPGTNLLTITASSKTPVQAQEIANAFANGYIANRYAAAIANLKAAVAAMNPQLNSLQKQIASLDAEIRTAGAKAGALQATLVAVTQQYQAIFSQQEELRVDIQLTGAQAELVGVAGLPSSPVSPKPLRDAELGAVAGLLFGLGIELLREKFDDKVRGPEELAQITSSPVLAEVPDDEQAASVSPTSARPGEFSEAMRTLRTGLQFLGVESPLRRIVVCSPSSGDGKTTVAANLAVAYAEAGFVTVLISGDLRRSRVEELFDAPKTGLGLSTLLSTAAMRPRSAATNGDAAHAAVEESHPERRARMTEFLRLQTVTTTMDNLTVIPGGPTPPNPAELLGSTRMREVLDTLGSHADVIIIDTPPALVVTDSVVLADASDGVLVVASAAKTTRRDLTRLLAMYEAVDVPVLGVVLNRAPRSRSRSAYYDAYYTAARPQQGSGSARPADTGAPA